MHELGVRLYKSPFKDIFGSSILFSGSCSLLRKVGPSLESRDFLLLLFSNSIINLRVMLWNAVDPDVSSAASTNETLSLVHEVVKVSNYCFVDFRDELMLKDKLSLTNKDCGIGNNVTHSNVPCSLTCYPKIVLGLVHLNKIWKINRFEIVTMSYRNQLSCLKDSLGQVGFFDVRPDKVD